MALDTAKRLIQFYEETKQFERAMELYDKHPELKEKQEKPEEEKKTKKTK